MKRVFVSYSHRNRNFAERLARDLSDAGMDVWIDFREIQGGEQWRDEIFKGLAQAEIVAACLSPEAVSSEWCRREISTARTESKLLIPVIFKPCFELFEQYDEIKWLPEIQFVDFQDGYEQAFPQLLESLPGLKPPDFGTDIDPATIPCPFKGLESFQQTDAKMFFGREDLTEKLLERLKHTDKERFLAVVGASGSGKSSLVRAGLIPALREGKVPDSERWPIVIFMPGSNPLQALATRLLPVLPQERPLQDILNDLEQGPQALHQLTETILGDAPANTRLLLVVDQFEEVFTRAGQREREQFLDMLDHAATVENGRTLLLITMRADFFDRLSGYPKLARLLEQENLLIATEMTLDNLRSTITGPAEAVGLIYEDGLVHNILEEVRQQPGSLPLLQYALKELYERREGRYLTQAAYDGIGGVRRALAQHAEDVYNSLDASQQDVMRRLLLRLVEVSDKGQATRRKVEMSDLNFQNVPDEVIHNLIENLTSADNRLLIASRSISAAGAEPKVWLEVSHEALIREWDRFTAWVRENQAELHQGSSILKAAHDWQATKQDAAYLLTGTRLDKAKAWLGSADSNSLQRNFIMASLAEAERKAAAERERQARELELQKRAAQRLRAMVVILMVFLVAAAGLSVFAIDRERKAEVAQSAAETERKRADEKGLIMFSRQLAAKALNQIDDQPALALLLSMEGNHVKDTPEARDSLLRGLARLPYLSTLLHGHTSGVEAVAYSPDGKLLASASSDRTVIIWDMATRQIVGKPLTGHENRLQAVAFSPDGKILASAGMDSKIILWDVATQKPIGQPLTGHKAGIWTVAFSPDGKVLASGSDDRSIIRWDVGSGKPIGDPLVGHQDSVYSLDFSPDGKYMASGGNDSMVLVWDMAGRQPVGYRMTGHRGAVWDVAFSPDSKLIASASDDYTVILWDAAGRHAIGNPLAEHTDRVYALAFSPDGRKLATGSSDTQIILWDMHTRQPSGKIFTTHTVEVWAIAFSPDGRFLASGNGNTVVTIWDVEAKPLVNDTLTGHGDKVTSVAFSPDGRLIASAGWDNNVILWDQVSHREVRRLFGHISAVNGIAFSPNGKLLAAGSDDKTVMIWNLETGRPVAHPFLAHTDLVWSVIFTPDSKTVISASWDNTIRFWDAATGRPIGQPLTEHKDRVFQLAMSPDGKTFASSSSDMTIILWDLATRKPIRRFTGHTSGVKGIAFSPDGKLLASAANDKTVRLWDVATGNPVGKPMSDHTDKVTNVTFSPNGKLLVSVSLDKTIILWDVATQTLIDQPITGHSDQILGVAISPDGKTLATGSWDQTVMVWDLEFVLQGFEAWQVHGCRIANRNLTAEEWQQSLGDEPYAKTCPDLR
jgi:WD40 repeat protein/energy-coupling factor transporter ATP-binding protein EcfA2